MIIAGYLPNRNWWNLIGTTSTFSGTTSKGSAVWSEFNIFSTLVTMTTAAILNLFNLSKAATHYDGYSYKVSWNLMKGIKAEF
jgi:hypothetical protein